MSGIENDPLVVELKGAQQEPLHDLFNRANNVLHDRENPDRLYDHWGGLSVSTRGKEVNGQYYRLTEAYSKENGGLKIPMRGLVAVDLVPDEAVINTRDRDYARTDVGQTLWRLKPAEIRYAGMGFDDVFEARIEDVTDARVASLEVSGWHPDDRRTETWLERGRPLEGEELAATAQIVGKLLDQLES